jgi:hypothetical protein
MTTTKPIWRGDPLAKKDLKALDVCKVAGCGIERREHTVAEREERLNHEFSSDGRLVVVDRSPRGREKGNVQRSSGRVPASAPGDPILRYLLVQKGLVTTDELDEAERILKSTGLLATSERRTMGLGRAAPDA